jgi:alkylated DNA repair dioxygenase AlkB
LIVVPGITYQSQYLPKTRASRLLQQLWQEIPWQQKTITLFGRQVLQPRMTAWASDPGVNYTYSGLDLLPAAWHPELQVLRDDLSAGLGTRFNSVLANAYRTGQDSMGWHSDNEPELGREPVIASISLGQQRRFLIRRSGSGPSKRLELEHGSLLLMQGNSQHLWQHSVPKTKKPCGLRINLTFRVIRSQVNTTGCFATRC